MTKEEVALELTKEYLKASKKVYDEYEVARIYNHIYNLIDVKDTQRKDWGTRLKGF